MPVVPTASGKTAEPAVASTDAMMSPTGAATPDRRRRVDEVAERRRESTDALGAHVEHAHEEEEPGDHEHDRMRAAPRRWAEEVDEHCDEDRDEEREEKEREERKEGDAPHESRSHARPVARRERLVRRPP